MVALELCDQNRHFWVLLTTSSFFMASFPRFWPEKEHQACLDCEYPLFQGNTLHWDPVNQQEAQTSPSCVLLWKRDTLEWGRTGNYSPHSKPIAGITHTHNPLRNSHQECSGCIEELTDSYWGRERRRSVCTGQCQWCIHGAVPCSPSISFMKMVTQGPSLTAP